MPAHDQTGLTTRLRAAIDRLPLTREGLLWGIIAVALLLMGLFKGINLVMLLASLVLALVGWNLWAARRQIGRVAASRLEGEPAFARTPFRWSVRLHNRGRRPVSGIDLIDGAAVPPQRWFVTDLPGGGAQVLQGEMIHPRRGRVAGGALRLESGHPLGLVRVGRIIEPARPRVVLPQLGHLHRGLLRRFLSRRSPSAGQSRGLPAPAPTAQAEFHGLRPYRPGDSPRHIHWRTSARHGELMVREFEDWPNDDLTVILEARRAPGEADDPHLEDAIRLTATVCWEWCRQTGDRLLLVVAGAETAVQDGATGRALAIAMLQHLALEPGVAEVDARGPITALQARHLPPGPVLVISPGPSVLAESLQRALRRRVAAVDVAAGDAAAFFES